MFRDTGMLLRLCVASVVPACAMRGCNIIAYTVFPWTAGVCVCE